MSIVIGVLLSGTAGCVLSCKLTMGSEELSVSDGFGGKEVRVFMSVALEGGRVTMSTSSLAFSDAHSGSKLEARRLSGEDARSGTSAAPPMMARWWVVLVKGEDPLG